MSDTSKYATSGKAYYEANKTTILAAEKETKRWLSYYERNRETVKERNRAAYYLRNGREVPPLRAKPAAAAPAPPPVELKRLEELVAELRTLVPEVMKKKARARGSKATPGQGAGTQPPMQQAPVPALQVSELPPVSE